jgi:hypothetical protein
MKPPATASEVTLMQNGNGVYEKYIGKCENGQKKRWRFGKDLSAAQVECLRVWNKWESRPEECESWEDLERWEEKEAEYTYLKKHSEELGKADEAERQAAIDKAVAVALGQKHVGDMPLGVAKVLYLKSQHKRIGLIGSLGIDEASYQITKYRLERALEFVGVNSMNSLDYPALETAIYAIAARPFKRPNPLASEEVKARQKQERITQSTALALIGALRAFVMWMAEEDTTGYTLPKHAKKLFNIRPEPEEQKITVVSQEQLKTLWDGAINENAKGGDKGKIRRLFLLLGLNCGFYYNDIADLTPDHIHVEGKETFVWKLRKKTKKTNSKLAKTKWYLWTETAELLQEYMPLNVSKAAIRSAFERLLKSAKVEGISHSNLRDTVANKMEAIGGRELADTFLAHTRKGVIDSYTSPDWGHLTKALKRVYKEFVKPAIG